MIRYFDIKDIMNLHHSQFHLISEKIFSIISLLIFYYLMNIISFSYLLIDL